MVRLVVPAQQGRGVRLKIGEQIRVVDLEGQQVGDLFAYCAEDISEYLSAEHTRVNVGRLFPLIGEAFSTNRRLFSRLNRIPRRALTTCSWPHVTRPVRAAGSRGLASILPREPAAGDG